MKLVQYEAMRVAVQQCVRIDEAAKIRDKATALAAYARQHEDPEVEQWLSEIRARASLRMGELILVLDKTPPANGRGAGTSESGHSKKDALSQANLRATSARRLELLARNKKKVEAYIDDARASNRVIRLEDLHNIAEASERTTRDEKIQDRNFKAGKKASATLWDLIHADPPWKFRPYSELSGSNRSPSRHYPLMDTETICQLIPGTFEAAPNAVLFLWATAPMLKHALQVMEAWGFEYKSHASWTKLGRVSDEVKGGHGYYFRSAHELILLGTRGNIGAPEPQNRQLSAFSANRGKHSEKPEEIFRIIEKMYPNAVNKLDMFGRKNRDGWTVEGNQVTLSEAAD